MYDGLNVRKATKNDEGFIFHTYVEATKPYGVSPNKYYVFRQYLMYAMKHIDKTEMYIIEHKENPIGFFEKNTSPQRISIEQIYLLPSYQRKGIGTLVLKALEREARNQRIPNINSTIPKKANVALAFFSKNGYQYTIDPKITRHSKHERSPQGEAQFLLQKQLPLSSVGRKRRRSKR